MTNKTASSFLLILLLLVTVPACTGGQGEPQPMPTGQATALPTTVPAESPTPAIPPTTGVETLALVNGTLIDGTGAAPVPDAVVVIRNGRIEAAGPRDRVSIPADARVIDVGGATILPGLINAHIHSGFSTSNLTAWAQAGVTTVRDLGSVGDFDLRDSLNHNPQHARLVAAGPLVSVPGGYPAVPWGASSIMLPVTSPDDARQKVNQLLDDGADLVKIAVERGRVFGRTIPTLSLTETVVIVGVAHARGTLVSAHVTSAGDLAQAVNAGADDIAHMVTDDVPDAVIAKMVQDGIYWTPTLELWNCVSQSQPTVANLKRFVSAGGLVALGTDYDGYSCKFDLGLLATEIGLM
ncbi:MAG: amidohydrolase family protein, partial [Chloroflexi bacterium]|nr:amidohydrolase family protein [Chloroflexota bacterium]